ncbi:hypothetical protein IHE45_06G089800 [Dioscorea alata]|uniref:Uncharacterized protein n=1 Tax=Dioscorea alata TaxID=55571 RepID=A0ACB7VZ06_DIOAL|nr:hypothetical protein IHE45_06G089800 [Dioscorea alata]
MPSSAQPLTLTLTVTLVLTLSPSLFALRPPSPSPSPSPSPYRPPSPKISKSNPTDLRVFPTLEPCSSFPSNRHDHHHRCRRRPATPPPREKQLNFGEKLGLLFSGVIIILQFGFAGFLIFKRLQLRKLDDEVALWRQ